MKIVVDADACPVKDEIIRTGAEFTIEVWMVASYDHMLQAQAGVRTIQVDRSSQSADLYISNHLQAEDILITQDYGLAAVALAKRAHVISFRGRIFTDTSIDMLLERRHEQARQRRAGIYGKGPAPYSKADRKKFLHTLTKVLQNCRNNRENSEY